jgi:uncharacterized protein with NAD-binding domain and iron-sulfur cluster
MVGTDDVCIDRMSRRSFLRSAGAAGLAFAAPRGLRLSGRQSVAIFGGGVAGLTAAHELAQRGFDVAVYERRAWGGKARSYDVPGSGRDGRRPLPGEHGFRIEFGFYQDLPDTLRRIPFGSSPNGVFDNLVDVPQFMWARDGGRRDLTIPTEPRRPAHTPAQVIDLLIGLVAETDLPPDGVEHFVRRMTVYMSSSDARRIGQWDNTTWASFIGTDRYSDDYRKLLGETFSQILVASKEEQTSAHFSARVLELVVYTLIQRGDGSVNRVFDAPTNEAWIDPWLDHLQRLGVRLQHAHSVISLDLRGDRIAGAVVDGPSGRRRVRADWYIVALPVERARRLWGPSIEAADPGLLRMHALETGRMNGIQFFLCERVPISGGHVGYMDSPWLVSSISQGQFWKRDFASSYGDGTVQDCISAIAADWESRGVLFGKAARDCTPDEIALEMWEQMKRHLNDTGEARLTDDLLHSWYLDPGLKWRGDRYHNEDPLILPTAGSRPNRPGVATAIPNLLLTGDYLDAEIETSSMDAANHNSRRAVNALLERSGSNETPCTVKGWYRPPEWEAAKAIDEDRYKRGRPHLLDTEATGPLPSQDRELVRHLGLESVFNPARVRA